MSRARQLPRYVVFSVIDDYLMEMRNFLGGNNKYLNYYCYLPSPWELSQLRKRYYDNYLIMIIMTITLPRDHHFYDKSQHLLRW